MSIQGYCVRCKSKQNMIKPHDEETSNGRPIVKGNCETCGGGMNVINRTIAQLQAA